MAPIHNAAARGNLDDLKRLVNSGANKNARDGRGRSPLEYAVNHKHLNIIQYLLKIGAIKNSGNSKIAPLHHAANRGYVNGIHALINAGANKNVRSGYNGSTPLHIAINRNKLNVVRTLLNAGANKNSRTTDGNSPLHIAVHRKYIEIVRALLNAGAKTNIKNKRGRTVYNIPTTKNIKNLLNREYRPPGTNGPNNIGGSKYLEALKRWNPPTEKTKAPPPHHVGRNPHPVLANLPPEPKGFPNRPLNTSMTPFPHLPKGKRIYVMV
jgi:ankyrin repeat protein